MCVNGQTYTVVLFGVGCTYEMHEHEFPAQILAISCGFAHI